MTLSRIDGVFRVESYQLTGSVVIHYDRNTTHRHALLAAISMTPNAAAAIIQPT